jgi:hypothetical protein
MDTLARWQDFLDEDGCLIGSGGGNVVSVEGVVPLSREPFMADLEPGAMAIVNNQLLPRCSPSLSRSARTCALNGGTRRRRCHAKRDAALGVPLTRYQRPRDPARRSFTRLTERAGLGRWHTNELPHSAVSLLSAAGVRERGRRRHRRSCHDADDPTRLPPIK